MQQDHVTFLQGISDFVGEANQSSASKSNRLAVVDPSYVYGADSTKVTFDGEDSLTTKSYKILGNNYPLPGGRVLLVPVGTTYLIIGQVESRPASLAKIHQVDSTGVSTGSQTTDWFSTSSISFDGVQKVKLTAVWGAASATTQPSTANVIIREDTTDLDAARVTLTVNNAMAGGSFSTIRTPSAGSHVFRFRIQWVNGGTITFAANSTFQAKLLVEPWLGTTE